MESMLIVIHEQTNSFKAWSLYAVLLWQGFLAVILLLWDAAHQLKGERSSTRVSLNRPDRVTGEAGQRNAALCFLGGWTELKSLKETQLANLYVCLLVYTYFSFFVVGMIPVAHVASLQNKISAMPNSISTDHLKHRLGTEQQKQRSEFSATKLRFKWSSCFD